MAGSFISVWVGSFYMIDDQDFYRAFGGVESQAELLADGGEEREAGVSREFEVDVEKVFRAGAIEIYAVRTIVGEVVRELGHRFAAGVDDDVGLGEAVQ